MTFKLTPEVEVHRDAGGQVTQLRHMRRRYSSREARLTNPTPAEIAEQYVVVTNLFNSSQRMALRYGPA